VRRQLSAEKGAAENASRLLENAMLQRLSRRRIARLAADIDMLDVEIVVADAALAHRYRLLTSSVGPVLACTLVALFPELGRMSRKQVAALVGVAPYAFESRKLKRKRCVWGDRAPIRHSVDRSIGYFCKRAKQSIAMVSGNFCAVQKFWRPCVP